MQSASNIILVRGVFSETFKEQIDVIKWARKEISYYEIGEEIILLRRMRDDVKMVFEQDPAARTTFEVITTYAGLHAVWSHLIAHKLYNKKRYVLARIISQISRFLLV